MSSDHGESSTAPPTASEVTQAWRGALPDLRIRGRNGTKADLLVFTVRGVKVAVKDYGPRAFLVRQTLGRWLTRRESRAYERVGGVEGTVAYLGRIGPSALATLWFDGCPLGETPPGEIPDGTFDRLSADLDGLHRRGIALGDLHHRDVLIGPSGDVVVVDLATAWILATNPGSWRRAIYERFREQDRIALARMRSRAEGGDERAAVAALGPRALARHMRGRRLKAFWDRLRRRSRTRVNG